MRWVFVQLHETGAKLVAASGLPGRWDGERISNHEAIEQGKRAATRDDVPFLSSGAFCVKEAVWLS
jgi:hypothetical protein